MSIGENIRKKMKQAGISQNELARRAGLSSSGMSTIINGTFEPRMDNLRQIAQALGCPLSDLLDEPDAQKEQEVPEDPLLDQLRNIAQQLTPERRQRLLDFARFQESEQK